MRYQDQSRRSDGAVVSSVVPAQRISHSGLTRKPLFLEI